MSQFAYDRDTEIALDVFIQRLRYMYDDGTSTVPQLLERHWNVYKALRYGNRVAPEKIVYQGEEYILTPYEHHAYFSAENFTDDRKE